MLVQKINNVGPPHLDSHRQWGLSKLIGLVQQTRFGFQNCGYRFQFVLADGLENVGVRVETEIAKHICGAQSLLAGCLASVICGILTGSLFDEPIIDIFCSSLGGKLQRCVAVVVAGIEVHFGQNKGVADAANKGH